MNSRTKYIYIYFNQLLLLASSSQYFWWELDKEEEPQLLWVEAAGSVWDLEPCGALRSSSRAVGSANSYWVWTQVPYQRSHTLTDIHITSKCTLSHTQRNKSTAEHTHISAWVIPKAFTTASLTGKKKEWERLSEKKKHCRTHKRLQRAQLSLVFQMQPEALDSCFIHFELPCISKHQCSLSIHLRPWGRKESLTIS